MIALLAALAFCFIPSKEQVAASAQLAEVRRQLDDAPPMTVLLVRFSREPQALPIRCARPGEHAYNVRRVRVDKNGRLR